MKQSLLLLGALCFAAGVIVGTILASAQFSALSSDDGGVVIRVINEFAQREKSYYEKKAITVHVRETFTYEAAPVEQFIMNNMLRWGWDKASGKVSGCDLWLDPEFSMVGIHGNLNTFRSELKGYYRAVEQFIPVTENVMKFIRRTNSYKVCDRLRLHPEGIPGLFPSGEISRTSMSGYLEPLATPMRHPDFCFNTKDKEALMSMKYLVHDFEHSCRRLKPTSRVVLIDLGASLFYHEEKHEVASEIPPIIQLLRLYEKFGFYFDHVYAFEVTFKEPKEVFETLDMKYMPSYHWINVGVNPKPGHKLNPLDSILRNFDEDDFVVLKIDVDNHKVELPLVKQLLEDETLHRLVDQFYFEHHVKWKEMLPIWRSAARGSLKESMELFRGLRDKGVAAHFWP